MNRQEANIILNQVREGIMHPLATVIKALTITGDIHARCTSLDSSTLSRGTHSDSPHMPDAALQN